MNNNKYKVLVIEDEENIRNLVKTLLETNGYSVVTAKNSKEAKLVNSSHCPDLIILDLGLPDADGTIFLREVRRDSAVPVIILSARTEEVDKVEALDMGANDYVTKPFGSAELVARVRSALRIFQRNHNEIMASGGKFRVDGLAINYDSRQVFIDGNEIKLTQTEYNIISLLSRHAGKVLTYTFIIKEIWGYNDLGSIKKLQVNMANVRKKFGAKPGEKNYIVNELGVGYRMVDEQT